MQLLGVFKKYSIKTIFNLPRMTYFGKLLKDFPNFENLLLFAQKLKKYLSLLYLCFLTELMLKGVSFEMQKKHRGICHDS